MGLLVLIFIIKRVNSTKYRCFIFFSALC